MTDADHATTRRPTILDMNAWREEAGAPLPSALQRRLDNLGAASVLFYREPLELLRGEGAHVEASDGRRYLDFYNNVPALGHCHPEVVAACTRQMARLNINTRYLSPVVDDFLEALKATLPAGLSRIVPTCTGSEANDLAMRLAMAASGRRGFVVTECAYHGNTMATTDISPAALKRRALPDHVIAVPAPSSAAYGEDIGRGFATAVGAAAQALERRGHGAAAFVCDSIFSSDGVYASPAGFLAEAVAAARAAGALWIADEVQPGFARTGAFWGFEHHAVEPDIITMGKPMGNGFPMAGVATTTAPLEALIADAGYFNTFGGNPVAAAAGRAVLDIIAREGLRERTASLGDRLRARLEDLAGRHRVIAEIRHRGLFLGIELGRDGEGGRPGGDRARQVVDVMRQAGVLIGTAGLHGQVLKVRPPLCIGESEIGRFVEALDRSLRDTGPDD